MTITAQERFERAKKLQQKVAEKRADKRFKNTLSPKIIFEHRNPMLTEQLGLCAICEVSVSIASKRYHLDHDHATGEIRGVLCHNCNVGLGHFRDSVNLLIKAINYLNKFRCVDMKLLINGKELTETIKEIIPQQSTTYEGVLSPEEFDKLSGKEKIEYLKSQEGKSHWWFGLPDVVQLK